MTAVGRAGLRCTAKDGIATMCAQHQSWSFTCNKHMMCISSWAASDCQVQRTLQRADKACSYSLRLWRMLPPGRAPNQAAGAGTCWTGLYWGCCSLEGLLSVSRTWMRSWISRPWKMLSSGKAPKPGSGCRYTLNRCCRCSTATLWGLLQYRCASCSRSALQLASASSACAPRSAQLCSCSVSQQVLAFQHAQHAFAACCSAAWGFHITCADSRRTWRSQMLAVRSAGWIAM